MRGLVAFDLWQWVQDNRTFFEPPVGNKVIWEDSQFTAMIVRGPNARRDFHVDPSDEIFYMLRGAMGLEYPRGRQAPGARDPRGRAPPRARPHPALAASARGHVGPGGRGEARAEQTESLLWFCERCDARLHTVTMHVSDIEGQLKSAIDAFDASPDLRTCRACGHVQPDRAPPAEPIS